jgi:DNA primase
MAIFEKKLRSIARTIKDDFIKKYVLEFFLEKISSLTPHSNVGKKQFYTKKIKSLQSTQKYFNESKSLSGVEIKEFSLLYLILNNLDIFQENIHLIENIRLFSDENKLIYETLLSKLKSGEKLTLEQIPIDPQLIEKIFKFASIKHILNSHQNNQEKMFELLDEVSRDLKNYDLEFRIEELESKFSKDLSESTFNELRELKKQKNIN